MSTLVDIILVIFLVLGTYAGTRKGLIKSAVSFIGLVAIIIISYSLKTPVANFLIDNFPFFQYYGGLTSLNILVYNLVSFVVIFILLYCILNIIITLTGFIDTLLKFTVIWIIPSKIGGALLGFLEAWVFLFLILFVLTQFNVTNSFINNSKVSDIILNHTPVVGTFLGNASNAAKDIYATINENKNSDVNTLNLTILQIEINYGLVTKDKAQELIDTGKMGIDNVLFGKGNSLWLNI